MCRQGGLTHEGLTEPWSGRRGDSAKMEPAEESAPLMCTRMVRTCCWSTKCAAELGVAEGVCAGMSAGVRLPRSA